MVIKRSKTGICRALLLALIAVLLVGVVEATDDSYNPFLHKPVVPDHPAVKLYGQYATNLFPGAATYSFPLEVPKGVNGLAPSVVLNYNSQAVRQRPGVVGAGWSVSQDGIYRDVNGTLGDTSDDKFTLILDGAEYQLVNVNGIYQTEVDYYFRIQNSSDYWNVTKQDGTRYRFGYNSDSKLSSNMGLNYSLAWKLDLVQDTHGNKIYYTYAQNPFPEDAGAIYLMNISYNSDLTRLITFNYESSVRPDRRRVYAQGNKFEESRRLANISEYYNNNLFRAYTLNYTSLSQSISSISSISQSDTSGTKLFSIQFSYYSPDPGFNRTSGYIPPVLFSDSSHTDYGVRLVDINNDGFADIVQSRQGDPTCNVWLNNKSGGWVLNTSWIVPVNTVTFDGKDTGVRFEDVNGDGYVDLIKAKNGARTVYLNNGTGWVASSWTFPYDFCDDAGREGGVRLADLNGDGKIDIVMAQNPGNENYNRAVYLNNGSGWVKDDNWIVPGDFLGYDKSDLGLRLVDLNGDGLADLVEGTNTLFIAWINNGTGWVNDTSWTPPIFFITSEHVDYGTRFADVNGDGLVDLLADHETASQQSTSSAWLNTGNGWSLNSSWQSTEAFTKDGYNVGRRLADVNGDGFADIVVSHQDSSTEYTVLKNATLPYLLKAVVNEFGGITTINYTNSTYFNNTDNGTSQIGFNIFVVKSVAKNNSLAGNFSTVSVVNYNYSLGKYNYTESEFRGFGIVTEYTPSKNVIHYFYQDSPRRGKEYRTETYDKNFSLYAVNEKTYTSVYDQGIYNLSIDHSTDYLYDGQSVPKITNTSYFYNSYGNYRYVIDWGDVNTTGDEKYYNYSYALNLNQWIINKPSRQTVYDTNGTKIKETKSYYDLQGQDGMGSFGDLTKTEDWNSNGNNIFNYLTYDQYGNPATKTDSLGNKITYSYDQSHTYLSAVINPLGHVSRLGYNSSTGNLLWKENNGIITNYTYDSFGRIKQEVQPYDSADFPTKKYAYDFDSVAPEQINISARTTANNYDTSRFIYDGFANLVQIKQEIENGQEVVKNILYDSSFRVGSEQNPYFSAKLSGLTNASTTANNTQYNYDSLDRVTSVINPDSTNKTVVFNQWNITDYDENQHKHTYLLNGQGKIVKVYEFNINDVGINDTYVTSYSYDNSGNLIQIVDSQGNVFSFTYDSLGRKTSMNDPDMGQWSYAYDTNGNLISQTGSNAGLVTGDGLFREYNGLGQLIRVRNGSTNTSQILEEYWYDQDGQRIKIKRYDSANTTIYTPFKEFMMVVNSSGSYNYTYVYQEGILVARVNPDGSKYYYHNDHLGSTSVLTNSIGGVLESTSYNPYGEILTGGSVEDSKLYTGQFNDALTGQYYYGARYYLPGHGQFGSADTTFQNFFEPQLLNHYAYARNNPYKFKDDGGNRVQAIKEVVGGGAITAIYVDGVYVGRAVNERVVSEFPLFSNVNGESSGESGKLYNYDIMPGDKNNAQGTLNSASYDTFGAKTISLNKIIAENEKKLTKDENVDKAMIVGGIGSSAVGGSETIGVSGSIVTVSRQISNLLSGASLLSELGQNRKAAATVSFMSVFSAPLGIVKGSYDLYSYNPQTLHRYEKINGFVGSYSNSYLVSNSVHSINYINGAPERWD